MPLQSEEKKNKDLQFSPSFSIHLSHLNFFFSEIMEFNVSLTADQVCEKWMNTPKHDWSETDHPSKCHAFSRFLIDEFGLKKDESLKPALEARGFYECDNDELTKKKVKFFCHLMKINPSEVEKNESFGVDSFWFRPFSAANGRFYECLVFSSPNGNDFILGLDVYTFLGGGLIKDEKDCNYHVQVQNLVLDPPPPPSKGGDKVDLMSWMGYIKF